MVDLSVRHANTHCVRFLVLSRTGASAIWVLLVLTRLVLWACYVCLFVLPAGLVAQQQCVGPLQLPISDVAVFAQSHQDITGLATAIGEQVGRDMGCPGIGTHICGRGMSVVQALHLQVSTPARIVMTGISTAHQLEFGLGP